MKHKGMVDWFDIEKGFGFIKSDSFENMIFVHFSAIETSGYKFLNKEDDVEFEVVDGNMGWQAKKVKKLELKGWGE